MAKIEVTEVKTYRCSDGKVYDSRDMAESHETELKNPSYKQEQKILELEKKILDLDIKIMNLQSQIECLRHPWGQINKQILTPRYPDSDCNPYTPYNGKVWYGTGENLTEALNNLKEVK